ncbi:hypothetical protein GWK08_10565 [Leptobacterium flavescens]|uniref:Uncharacterized protein n=1 Tax=Leptobacterium flavescens TaxID=472055 RepID=A0A6P0UKY9_9FLAO|nr:hypothetical protein [Leptobacterium flavescens]NER13884.1 hypothetical protein [Leptobacterium flavescens]
MKYLLSAIAFLMTVSIYAQDIKRSKPLENNGLKINAVTSTSSVSLLPANRKTTVNMATASYSKQQFATQSFKTELPKVKVYTSRKPKNINTVYKELKAGPYNIPGAGGYGFCVPRSN